MSSGGKDSAPQPGGPVDQSLPIRILKVVASSAFALMVVALLALLVAPKDPGTLTLYGMVIGLNLLIVLGLWPAIRWLQRFGNQPG